MFLLHEAEKRGEMDRACRRSFLARSSGTNPRLLVTLSGQRVGGRDWRVSMAVVEAVSSPALTSDDSHV